MPFDANLEQFGAVGSQYTFYAIKSGLVPHGTDGNLAAAEDSGMGRIKQMVSLTATVPEDRRVNLRGDNATWAQQVLAADTLPSGNMLLGMFDANFSTKISGTGIYTDGQWDMHANTVSCRSYEPLAIVVNSPAKSGADGSLGESGWQVTEYLFVEANSLNPGEINIDTPQEYPFSLTINETAYPLWGDAFSNQSDWGLVRAFVVGPYASPYPVTYHTYIGDGTASQTVTLDYTPAGEDSDNVVVWDFTPSTSAATKLDYTTNYTVSASTKVVTFATDPADGNAQIIKYQFVPEC